MKKHVILITVACMLSNLPVLSNFFNEVSTFFSKDLPTHFDQHIQIVPEGMANAYPQIAQFNLPRTTEPLASGSVRFIGAKSTLLPILQKIDEFFSNYKKKPGLYVIRRYLKHQDISTLGLTGKEAELYRAYQRQPDEKIPTKFKKFHIASYNDPKFAEGDKGRVFSGDRERVDVFYIIDER